MNYLNISKLILTRKMKFLKNQTATIMFAFGLMISSLPLIFLARHEKLVNSNSFGLTWTESGKPDIQCNNEYDFSGHPASPIPVGAWVFRLV